MTSITPDSLLEDYLAFHEKAPSDALQRLSRRSSRNKPKKGEPRNNHIAISLSNTAAANWSILLSSLGYSSLSSFIEDIGLEPNVLEAIRLASTTTT